MIGASILNLRKSKNLSQAELAQALGISRSALSLYEIGKREPDFKLLCNIANYFDVSTDYLLGISSQDTASGSASPLSPEEEELIDAYRRADEGIKISVCKLLDVKKEKAPQIKEA
jgi:transcriptional regulator with XRE-family HTH domain